MPQCYWAHTCPASPSSHNYLVPTAVVDLYPVDAIGAIYRDNEPHDVVSIDRSQEVPSPNWDQILMSEDDDCASLRRTLGL